LETGKPKKQPELFMTTNVFVYGTLKRGFGNHFLLNNATFVGEYTTKPMYRLFASGLPFLSEGGNKAIKGEVYAVDDATLAALDRLEGHPNAYRREAVKLEGFADPVVAYFFQGDLSSLSSWAREVTEWPNRQMEPDVSYDEEEDDDDYDDEGEEEDAARQSAEDNIARIRAEAAEESAATYALLYNGNELESYCEGETLDHCLAMLKEEQGPRARHGGWMIVKVIAEGTRDEILETPPHVLKGGA
jgi:gamma-glutamylcyclotransferase (GGCT)/AIG2-like uncharacterized protein YtfP